MMLLLLFFLLVMVKSTDPLKLYNVMFEDNFCDDEDFVVAEELGVTTSCLKVYEDSYYTSICDLLDDKIVRVWFNDSSCLTKPSMTSVVEAPFFCQPSGKSVSKYYEQGHCGDWTVPKTQVSIGFYVESDCKEMIGNPFNVKMVFNPTKCVIPPSNSTTSGYYSTRPPTFKKKNVKVIPSGMERLFQNGDPVVDYKSYQATCSKDGKTGTVSGYIDSDCKNVDKQFSFPVGECIVLEKTEQFSIYGKMTTDCYQD